MSKKNISTFDRWSYGHIIFGLMTGLILSLFFQLYITDFAYTFIFAGIIVAIFGWELLEQTFIPKWKESKNNTFGDIIIGLNASLIMILVFYIILNDIMTTVLMLILTSFFALIFIIITKKNKKKKGKKRRF